MKKLLIVATMLAMPLGSYAFMGFFDDHNDRIERLTSENYESSSRQDELKESKLNEQSQRRQVNQIKANQAALNRSIADYRAKKSNLEKTIAGMNGVEKAIQSDIDQHKTEMKQFKQKIKDYEQKKNQASQLSQDITQGTAKVRESEKSLALKQKEFAKLADKVGKGKATQEDLLKLLTDVQQKRAKIKADKAAIKAKEKTLEKVAGEREKLKIKGSTKGKIAQIQSLIDADQARLDIYKKDLKAKKADLLSATNGLTQAQTDLQEKGKSLADSLTKLSEASKGRAAIEADMAKMSATNVIGQMLMDGNQAKHRARMMFSNLEDTLSSLESSGVSREFALEQLKAQLVQNIDNTPLGLYVQEKIAQNKGAASCEQVNQCIDMRAASVDSEVIEKAGQAAGKLVPRIPASKVQKEPSK